MRTINTYTDDGLVATMSYDEIFIIYDNTP